MPANIRVYELARELGLTNKEALDLCVALGIGVKSHSSSIVEPQADRVRRKAEREGLIRTQQPPEPEPVKSDSRKAPRRTEADTPAPSVAPAATAAPTPPPAASASPSNPAPSTASPVAAPAPVAPGEVSRPAASQPTLSPPVPSAPVPSSQPLAPAARVAPSDASVPPAPPRRVISSSGGTRPAPPAAPQAARPAPPTAPSPAPAPAAGGPDAPRRPRPLEPGRPRPQQGDPGARPRPAAGDGPPRPGGVSPTSTTGRPIPPPPRPMSATGRPIPPPPGPRRATGPGGPGGARPGGPGGPNRGARPGGGAGGAPSGPGGARPGGGGGFGAPRFGAPRPGGAPGGAPSGPGRGGPGGGRPGDRRPGGPQGRRKGRRRRVREELQPIGLPVYTPRDAAVPEGTIVIERGSSPQDIGPKLNRTAADVVRFLMQQGEMVTATQSLNDDMVELFVAEIGAQVRLVNPGEEQEVELLRLLEVPEDIDDDTYESLPPRPPVVTVMGHVDHGKTKLLDRIRNANVVAGEAGGITQHIGAYQVDHNGQKITFIDTPGHEAFTAMRARGAEATDIVILVVAADDGVMPQTIEALDHAKAADVPIVVAINKIDRAEANPDRVMQQLSERGLIPEQWGGDTVYCEVSALQGHGIEELLENLLVVAEVEDLRAENTGRSRGLVLEAHLDIGRGPVATILVQHGELKVGDPLVAGSSWGRVRALVDDKGKQIKSAGPATPVQVLGLSEVPNAGDKFVVAPNEKVAGRVAQTREHWYRMASLARDAAIKGAGTGGARLEDIFQQIRAGETATLNLIIKADVGGSLEALTESLRKLERDDVKVAFVRRGVGGISESDITLAAASNATIIGFNVRPTRQARAMADTEKVEIRTYEIIYKVIEEIQNAMLGLLAPEFEEVVTGDAEVREIFSVPKIGRIAGCMVLNGTIARGSKVRFLREGTIIWKGEIASLRRFKDDAREVHAGFECGIGLSDFQDLKPGDVIETFDLKEIPRA